VNVARAVRVARVMRVLLGIAVCVGVGCAVPPFKQIEKRAAADLAIVNAVVAPGAPVVEARLRALFAGGRTPLQPPYARFRLEDRAGGVFPGDERLREDSADNPALERYLTVAPSLRAADFYLVDVSDTFWPSEYFYRGEPARFRTDFIVHLGAVAAERPEATRLEVIEVRPLVWVGTRFGLGHAGPAFLRDTRGVAPTTRDRQAVLDQLVRGLTAAASP
jgi:hypothetical protein